MNTRQQGGLRLVSWILALCLVVYITGRPLYWQLSEGLNASSQPLLSLPQGLSNNSITDFMKENPLMSEEMEKSFIDLLSEEVKVKEAEICEKNRHADRALLEAKK